MIRRAVTGGMKDADLVFQSSVLKTSTALWTLQPGIVTRTGDFEQRAHAAYLERLPVGRDETQIHF